MRRLSVTLLATTLVSLAATHPSFAGSPKAMADDNCAMAKGDATMVIKNGFGLTDTRFGDLALLPVYRIDRTHLMPRTELALHRHVRPDRPTATIVEQPVAMAAKAKVPMGYADNTKQKSGIRAGLPGGFERPVAPVLAGLLLSAYA